MRTHFASAERTTPNELAQEIQTASNSPIMDGLLSSAFGLLAVLDENRQIVAVNDSFLKFLGITDPAEVLGLRHGELLQCPHSTEEAGGCGTSKCCSTCGAAIAIVSALDDDNPHEETCTLNATIDGKELDLVFHIKSHPMTVEGQRFLLLFLRDITTEQNRAAIERTFYHDLSNIICSLSGASEMLLMERGNKEELIDVVHQTAAQLQEEIAIQKYISQNRSGHYSPTLRTTSIPQLQKMLLMFYASHPAKKNKSLKMQLEPAELKIQTDVSLLIRILVNMITNALEATEQEQTVQVRSKEEKGTLVFCVQNSQSIPDEIARRIFERNFSTKGSMGRGLGTYSMKLFGEQVLGGKVSFTTSKENGTVFRFALPTD